MKHDRGGVEEGKNMSARDTEARPHHTVTQYVTTLEDSDIMANVGVVSADLVDLSNTPMLLVEHLEEVPDGDGPVVVLEGIQEHLPHINESAHVDPGEENRPLSS